jgi:hypothetical protein
MQASRDTRQDICWHSNLIKFCPFVWPTVVQFGVLMQHSITCSCCDRPCCQLSKIDQAYQPCHCRPRLGVAHKEFTLLPISLCKDRLHPLMERCIWDEGADLRRWIIATRRARYFPPVRRCHSTTAIEKVGIIAVTAVGRAPVPN